MMTRAKIQSWQDFVTKEGNREPWGIAYKTVARKLRGEATTSTLKTPLGYTSNWRTTAAAMLSALLPDDEEDIETEEQKEIRRNSTNPPNVEDTPEFSFEELRDAVKRLRKGKCPGPDLIEVEIIQRAWGRIHQELLRVMNGCLAWGIFPKRWKVGNVITIPKGPDRDRSSPKSYRPICLLSMVGKLLERLMATRMAPIFHDHALSSDRQYGFRPGRSTVDAITKLREKVEQMSEKRYVLAIALDISGAFDNVWWPNVLHELKRRGCPDNLYRLTRSYFSERTVQIAGKNEAVSKPVTKGCPQGSVLGPSFWNLVFDDLLAELAENATECEPIAYADDIVILIAGNTRNELQKKGQEVVTRVPTWCTRKKLTLSEQKTEMLLVKGKLDAERPPIIKISGRNVRMEQAIKYLGVHLEGGLKVNKHVEAITGKCQKLFNSLARVAKAKWGLGHAAMRTLYRGLYEPITTYAAAGWSDLLKGKARSKLIRSQRMALLRVTKAYRTTSTEALQVIAGVIPIDLLVEIRARLHNKKRRRDEAPDEKTIVGEALEKWQERWQTTPKGRTTFDYFASIKDRLENRWVRPDHYTTQFISGHGDFNGKLKSFNLSELDTCECGEIETAHHILEDCPIFNEERQEFRNALGELDRRWPEEKREYVTKDVYPHFCQFARKVLQAKEEKRRNALREMEGATQPGRLPERGSTQLEGQAGRPLRHSPRLAQRVPEQRWEQEEETNEEGPTEEEDGDTQ